MTSNYKPLQDINNVFETEEEQDTFLKFLETYNNYQIPPSLETASKHKKSNRIGQKIDVNVLNRNVRKKLEICPCCCRIESETYSLCKRSTQLINYGLTIPSLFNFLKYTMTMMLVMMISGITSIVIQEAEFLSNTEGEGEEGEEGGRLGTIILVFIDTIRQGSPKASSFWMELSPYLNLVLYILLAIMSLTR